MPASSLLAYGIAMVSIQTSVSRSFLVTFITGFLIGILSLSSFYYLLLFAVTRDPMHPIAQFQLLQPWMSLLLLGFGIQFGLFWLLRHGFRLSLVKQHQADLVTGTGVTVSGLAMVACCAHHLVDLLPILGFSAAALFLSEYQQPLLITGVVANLFGIVLMLWFITGQLTPRLYLNFFFNHLRRTS